MKTIDATIIKRNYFYVIYNILKDETEKNGKHLSIKEICNIILNNYNLNIDKNTVNRVFEDLIVFGFDIKKDSSGYYLGNRILTDGEMGLLIDGIESISVLSPDAKIEIYEKICKMVGKKVETIDYYLYNQNQFFVKEELVNTIDRIYTAIGQNKALELYEPISFKFKIIDQLTDEEDAYFNNLLYESRILYTINPYQIFRSKNNEIYLLFYYKLPTRYVTGALNLSIVDDVVLEISDKARDKVDSSILLSKDLTDFTSPREYSKKESILEAELIPNKDGYDQRMEFQFILDLCESYTIKHKNNIKIYEIKYKYKNEQEIISLCTECYKYFKVLSGSNLYDELKRIYESLKYNYS